MIDYSAEVDFGKSTMDDLQAAFVQAGADLVAVENRRTEILALMESRMAEAKAKATVSGLSTVEIDALKVELQMQPPMPSADVAPVAKAT